MKTLFIRRSPYPLSDFRTSTENLRKSRPELKSSPRYVFVNAAYHDFVDTNPKSSELRKPDLVLALNCGFVFYKEWDASLPSMVTFADVPLIFTEYYHEDCKLDLQKLGWFWLVFVSEFQYETQEALSKIFPFLKKIQK